MKKFAIYAFLAISGSKSFASQTQCNFTEEQSRLISKAASYGLSFGYKKTLAAIVVQESFVGKYVVRINPKDGEMGSYGITHILLETAMYLEGIDNKWYAKDVVVEELIKNDLYALGLAVKKLDSIHKGDWMQTWSRYNGGSTKYANSIKNNIRKLEHCGYFSDWG